MWIARIQWRKRPLKTTETTIQGLKAANNKHQRKNRHRKAFVTNLLFRYTKYCMRPNVITKEENNWKKKSPKTKYKTRHKCWLHMHINDDNTIFISYSKSKLYCIFSYQSQKHLAWKSLCPYEFAKINNPQIYRSLSYLQNIISKSLLSRSKTFQFCNVVCHRSKLCIV